MNAASLDTCNLPAIMSPARIGAFIQFHDEDSQMSINKLLIAMTLGLALAACSKQEAQDAAATADAAATETQAAADQAATAEAAAPAEAAAETTAADAAAPAEAAADAAAAPAEAAAPAAEEAKQ